MWLQRAAMNTRNSNSNSTHILIIFGVPVHKNSRVTGWHKKENDVGIYRLILPIYHPHTVCVKSPHTPLSPLLFTSSCFHGTHHYSDEGKWHWQSRQAITLTPPCPLLSANMPYFHPVTIISHKAEKMGKQVVVCILLQDLHDVLPAINVCTETGCKREKIDNITSHKMQNEWQWECYCIYQFRVLQINLSGKAAHINTCSALTMRSCRDVFILICSGKVTLYCCLRHYTAHLLQYAYLCSHSKA